MEVYQFGDPNFYEKQNDTRAHTRERRADNDQEQGPECCLVRQDLLSYCRDKGIGEFAIYFKDDVPNLDFGFVVLNMGDDNFNEINHSNLYTNIFSVCFNGGWRSMGKKRDLLTFEFEFKRNRHDNLLLGFRFCRTSDAYTKDAVHHPWSERKVSYSPHIVRFAIIASQSSIAVLSKSDAERVFFNRSLLDKVRIDYMCIICYKGFQIMAYHRCGHLICVGCDIKLNKLADDKIGKKVKCSQCNDMSEWIGYARFRDGPCPIEDGCLKGATEPRVLFPCGCVLPHQPFDDIQICPYDLCQQKIDNFTRLYIDLEKEEE